MIRAFSFPHSLSGFLTQDWSARKCLVQIFQYYVQPEVLVQCTPIALKNRHRNVAMCCWRAWITIALLITWLTVLFHMVLYSYRQTKVLVENDIRLHYGLVSCTFPSFNFLLNYYCPTFVAEGTSFRYTYLCSSNDNKTSWPFTDDPWVPSSEMRQ